jgi:signal transduction histidine kinase
VVYAVVFALAARAIAPSQLPGLWVWTMAALWISGRGASAGVLVTMGAIAGVLALLGLALRDRTEAREELAATSAERDAASARSAVLAERTRIARELHDVVAHHMAMISIQAQAAPLRIPDLPPAAAQTFGLIEHAARQALAETRGIVGLLRGEELPADAAHAGPSAQDPEATQELAVAQDLAVAPAAERLPAPTLDNIPELVEAARAGGLPVTLSLSGSTQSVPASTALTAYRMVQEGLANAAAHAPGAAVQVEVARTGEVLRVNVVNGPPAEAPE